MQNFIKLMGNYYANQNFNKRKKKLMINPLDYIGIPFSGQVVMRIAIIYNGSCLSLVCEAKEVLIEEI